MALARPWVGPREEESLLTALRSGWYGPGEQVRRFESALGALTGAGHVVAVSSGTAALQLALEAAGVGGGDEVVVPSLTYCATVQAVVAAGATPVFAEVDPTTGCLDADDAATRVTARTRAVVPVHYGGHAPDLRPLEALVHRHDLALVEDAAHALGSRRPDGTPVGAGSGVACFSFDPIKAVTCGQGGAVATTDGDLAHRVLVRADLGLEPGARQRVVDDGYRLRMGDLNAALGRAQLEAWDEIVRRRRHLWARYAEAVAGLDGVRGLDHRVDDMVPFFFVVVVPDGRRDAVRAHLDRQGVDSAVHYPPNHLQPRWAGEGGALPVTERLAAEILTLPFHTGLGDDEVDRVVEALAEAVSR